MSPSLRLHLGSRRQRRGSPWLQRSAWLMGIGLGLFALGWSGPAAPAEAPSAEDPAPQSIGSITTRSPYCYQPDRERDECFLGFELHFVSSTANMIRLQVSISGRRVLEDRGFFQNTMLIGQAEAGRPGFKVACGLSGSGGDPDPLIGRRYPFTIRAEDSDGLVSQNFGSFSCPAFVPIEIFRNGFEGS